MSRVSQKFQHLMVRAQSKPFRWLFEWVFVPSVLLFAAYCIWSGYSSGRGDVLRFEQGFRRATAWVFDEGLVVTAAHALDPAWPFEPMLWLDDRPIVCEVVAIDMQYDIAVLRIAADLQPFSRAAIASGDDCTIAGFPIAFEFLNETEGIVTGKVRNGLFGLSAVANSGNSGGPVMDSSGRVVGMIVGIQEDAGGPGAGLPVFISIDLIEQVVSLQIGADQ